jgi:hypothetical protein
MCKDNFAASVTINMPYRGANKQELLLLCMFIIAITRRRIGGATAKKDRPESGTDGRLVVCFPEYPKSLRPEPRRIQGESPYWEPAGKIAGLKSKPQGSPKSGQ